MRILILTQNPQAASFRVRWARFVPRFEEHGDGVEVAALPASGRGRLFARSAEFDLVVLQRRLLPCGDLRRLRARARRLVYDFDDALCFRPRPPHRSRTRAARFFRTVAAADLVIAGNRYLASLARLRARDVVVVPPAIEPQRYRVSVPKLKRPTAVWIGQRVTLFYLEAVREEVLRSGYALHVIADAAPPGATWIPWSPAAEPYRLGECHVGLMPLTRDPYARGKCGYKLLQYYAAGLPAVASPVGVHRVLAAGGALPAREPREWEAALARLAADGGLRERLGGLGRSFVARRYASSSLAERLVRLLKT